MHIQLIVSQQTVKEVIPEKFNLLFSMKTTAGSEEEQGQKQSKLQFKHLSLTRDY